MANHKHGPTIDLKSARKFTFQGEIRRSEISALNYQTYYGDRIRPKSFQFWLNFDRQILEAMEEANDENWTAIQENG